MAAPRQSWRWPHCKLHVSIFEPPDLSESALFGGAFRSIGQGEALADVRGLLEFVHDRHGEVFDRDLPGIVAVHEDLVAAQAESPSANAGSEDRCRRDEGPGEGLLIAKGVERIARGTGLGPV